MVATKRFERVCCKTSFFGLSKGRKYMEVYNTPFYENVRARIYNEMNIMAMKVQQ